MIFNNDATTKLRVLVTMVKETINNAIIILYHYVAEIYSDRIQKCKGCILSVPKITIVHN